MLNFRRANIFFASLLILMIGINIEISIPVYFYFVLLVIYSVVIFFGCINIQSNFFIKVICASTTVKKEIAISFDDGPSINYTPQILALLKKEGVRAAFFCIGSRIAGNEILVKKIIEEGHIIGNHTYSHHFWFDMFSSKNMLKDLKMMDQEVIKITGLQPKLFRPPYGVTNPNLKKAIINGGYTPIGWNVRSMDTVVKDKNKFFHKICSSIKPGAVFLFHDTSKITLEVLLEFIKEVKRNGFEIVPLDKLLNLKPYA